MVTKRRKVCIDGKKIEAIKRFGKGKTLQKVTDDYGTG